MVAVIRCHLLVLVLAAVHHGTKATRNPYDEALATSYLKRAYRLSRSQAGSSSIVHTSGGVSSSSGGGAVISSSTDASGVYGGLTGVYPSYNPGATSVVTAGTAGTVLSPNDCDQCNEKFESQLELYDHKRAHHTVPGDAHCYLCNFTYKYRKNYIGHLRTQHPKIAAAETERQNILASEGKGDRTYVCPICRKRYRSYHGLRDHYKSHTSDDTTCHLCGLVYSTRAIFKRHMLDTHPGVEVPEPTESFRGTLSSKKIETGPFVCEKCGRSYVYKRNLKVHLKSHETSETYCCYCKQTFSSKHSYNTHMERRHPEDSRIEKAVEFVQREERRPMKCNQCDRSFKNADSLRHHKKVHEGKTKCELCGAQLNSRSAYYIHKRNEHPKKN